MKKKGFSLIEIMVAVAIMAVLSTIALFGLKKAQASARDTARAQIMNGIRTALEKYYADKGQYTSAFSGSACSCSGGACVAGWEGAYRQYFITMLNDLYGCGYLTGNLYDPKYPTTKALWNTSNPGWNNNGGALSNSICPNGDTLTAYSVRITGDNSFDYWYCASSNGQSYRMVLTKEGGGTSVFTSPQ